MIAIPILPGDTLIGILTGCDDNLQHPYFLQTKSKNNPFTGVSLFSYPKDRIMLTYNLTDAEFETLLKKD